MVAKREERCRGAEGRVENLRLAVANCHIYRMEKQQGPGHCIQYPVINYNGKEYICLTELLLNSRNYHNIVNQLYFNKNNF